MYHQSHTKSLSKFLSIIAKENFIKTINSEQIWEISYIFPHILFNLL